MAITTYAELLTSVQNFAHRTDLSSVIGDLFTRAEADLNRKLKLLQQEQRTTLATVPGSRFVTLPSNCLEIISLQLDIGGGVLRKLTKFPAAVLDQDFSSNTQVIPSHFRVGNDQIEFDVLVDAAYTLHMHWFKKWDLEGDTTNWLLDNYPDLYMDAVLAEVGLYTRDGDMASAAKGMVAEKIADLIHRDARARNNVLVGVDDALLSAGQFDILRG